MIVFCFRHRLQNEMRIKSDFGINTLIKLYSVDRKIQLRPWVNYEITIRANDQRRLAALYTGIYNGTGPAYTRGNF